MGDSLSVCAVGGLRTAREHNSNIARKKCVAQWRPDAANGNPYGSYSHTADIHSDSAYGHHNASPAHEYANSNQYADIGYAAAYAHQHAGSADGYEYADTANGDQNQYAGSADSHKDASSADSDSADSNADIYTNRARARAGH